MTRYMITFRSVGTQKVTKKVPQQVGEYVVNCLANNKNVVINGDFFSVVDIESVKKINKDNGFSKDYCEQEKRKELLIPEERKYIESKNQDIKNDSTLDSGLIERKSNTGFTSIGNILQAKYKL